MSIYFTVPDDYNCVNEAGCARGEQRGDQFLLERWRQGPKASEMAFNSRSCGSVKSAPASAAALPLRETCTTPMTRLLSRIGELIIFWIGSLRSSSAMGTPSK